MLLIIRKIVVIYKIYLITFKQNKIYKLQIPLSNILLTQTKKNSKQFTKKLLKLILSKTLNLLIKKTTFVVSRTIKNCYIKA